MSKEPTYSTSYSLWIPVPSLAHSLNRIQIFLKLKDEAVTSSIEFFPLIITRIFMHVK